jgi:serine/threonine protein kinase/predicted protein tyrosine phosphatase
MIHPEVIHSISKITDRMYLSDYSSTLKVDELVKLGIRYIFNVCNDIKPESILHKYAENGIYEYHFPINDLPNESILPVANKVLSIVEKNPETIFLVHCHMGISRSGSTVIWIMMNLRHMSYKDAYHLVKKKRICVHPNHGFESQLVEAMKELKPQFINQETKSKWHHHSSKHLCSCDERNCIVHNTSDKSKHEMKEIEDIATDKLKTKIPENYLKLYDIYKKVNGDMLIKRNHSETMSIINLQDAINTVEENYKNWKLVPIEFRFHPKVLKICLDKDPHLISDIPEEFLIKDLLLGVVMKDGCSIKYISKDDLTLEIVKEAVKQNFHAEQYIPKNFRDQIDTKRTGLPLFILLKYDVGDYIGKGSYGKVIDLKDENDKHWVCKTELVDETQNHCGISETTLREIAFLQTLKEKNNVIQVKEIGFNFENGTSSIVMEKNNKSLYHMLRHDLNITFVERRNILTGIIKGIHSIHTCGIIHNDLNVANITVGERKNGYTPVKLIDFGFSFIKSPLVVNIIGGSYIYRSPEMVLGLDCDYSSDIWSLGILTIQLFFGIRIISQIPTPENFLTYYRHFSTIGDPIVDILNFMYDETGYTFKDDIHLENNIKKIKPSYLNHDHFMLILDFVSKCLRYERNKRISITDAYSHPLIGGLKPSFESIDIISSLNYKDSESVNLIDLSIFKEDLIMKEEFKKLVRYVLGGIKEYDSLNNEFKFLYTLATIDLVSKIFSANNILVVNIVKKYEFEIKNRIMSTFFQSEEGKSLHLNRLITVAQMNTLEQFNFDLLKIN